MFFIIELPNGKYYVSPGVFTDDKEKAYRFMIRYYADKLAKRINGKVVWYG